MLARGHGSKTITIANGATTSAVVPFGSYAMAGVIMPASLDGTALTFEVSADGTNFTALDDGEGAAVGLTVAASKAYALPDALAVWAFFRLVMGTSQTGATDITVVFKD